MSLDSSAIRRHFPFLNQSIRGNPIVYLDSAATAQKPDAVLDAMRRQDETATANVHRGMHVLAERATDAYEGARETVRRFVNAKHTDEIIFTKSTTESINLVARSLGSTWQEGDAVLLSLLEHHSNIVPWLQLKEEKGIDVRWVDIDAQGQIDLQSFEKQMEDGRVKMLSITGQSNVLGTRPPLKEMIIAARAKGARVMVDAAQLVGHAPIDVATLDCDFLAFSGHKLYGPTGIGVLYGKRERLKELPPFLGGGMMIREVTRDHFTVDDAPAKFEAGTPPITQAVGLAAAIDWLQQFSWSDREAHEQELLNTAVDELVQINGVKILGYETKNQERKTKNFHGCISFVIDDIHPHDLTDLLGQRGICLRAGHHCTQPLHTHLGINASARLSIGLYNTVEEIQLLPAAIQDAVKKLK
ncbi:MAG TPA: cysteine desulfurase [Candidatus Peribacteraceae bacterium]|nr:cysteine desulfurase [Candidatus Peribacteraceae bacterium]